MLRETSRAEIKSQGIPKDRRVLLRGAEERFGAAVAVTGVEPR